MKKNLIRSVAGLGAVTVAMAGLAVLAPSSAQAATLGNATISPASGTASQSQSIATDGPCLSTATAFRVKAFGFGFPVAGANLTPQTGVGFSTTDAMNLPVGVPWQLVAEDYSTYLDGAYTVEFQCVSSLGQVRDIYTTTLNFTTPGNSAANVANATYTTASTNAATTTALSVSPASPIDEGTAVDLTATVAPAAATGTVQFFDGATSLGTGTLNAGVATLNGVNLADGTHSLTATYLGATVGSTNYTTSTSPAQTFVVNNVVVNTTTTIAVNGSGAQYSPVVIDATVAPNNAVGTVQFFDGATQIGSKPLASGTASLTVPSPALGAHSYTATFVPTNAGDYATSTSSASAYTVTASAGEIENITVDIPAGSLILNVLDDGAVLLNGALATDGSKYTASGAMDQVRVTDTRAGAFGWTANGQLGDFFQGGNPSIAAENLGWSPVVTDESNALLSAVAGPVVAPAAHVAIAAGTGEGLATQRVLASASAGSSVGSVLLDATLNLDAPTTTTVGTHTAILTLTAI